MPAKAGIQNYLKIRDFRPRGNDIKGRFKIFYDTIIIKCRYNIFYRIGLFPLIISNILSEA